MSNRLRQRSSVRTAVVWEALQKALDRRIAATGRTVLDILDTGGGTGGFAVPLARLGHRLTVVDPSPDALAALERRAAETGVSALVRAVQGDASGLLDVVAPDSFDLVLCHRVLEFVDDPAEALAGIIRTVRPEGTVSVLSVNRDASVLSQAVAGHFAAARRLLEDPDGRWGEGDPLPRRLRPHELSALIEAAGLRVETVHAARVFADLVPEALVNGDPEAFDALLALESAVAERPAFLTLAAEIHVLATRP